MSRYRVPNHRCIIFVHGCFWHGPRGLPILQNSENHA
ncbi:hypothetical protein ACCT09_18985 [Rhizobium ruizarguesonis]